MLRFVASEPSDATRTWRQKAQIILVPILGSFACAFFIILVCIVISAVMRPDGVHADESAHVEGKSWNGTCASCDSLSKYALVCGDSGKSMWTKVDKHRYDMQRPALLDLDHWCTFGELRHMLKGTHAAIWPWVFALLFVLAALVYDRNAGDEQKLGTGGTLMRTCGTVAIYMFTLLIVWAFTKAADGSPEATSSAVVYTFSMVSLSLQVPWRVLTEHASFLDKASILRTFLFWGLWFPSFVYTLLLVLALGMTGRVFHTVGNLVAGLGWCFLFMAVIVVVHVLPIDLLLERKDRPQRLEEPKEEALDLEAAGVMPNPVVKLFEEDPSPDVEMHAGKAGKTVLMISKDIEDPEATGSKSPLPETVGAITPVPEDVQDNVPVDDEEKIPKTPTPEVTDITTPRAEETEDLVPVEYCKAASIPRAEVLARPEPNVEEPNVEAIKALGISPSQEFEGCQEQPPIPDDDMHAENVPKVADKKTLDGLGISASEVQGLHRI